MTDRTMSDDTLLDLTLPTPEPEIYTFDGDVVAISVQKPLPEWGEDAKDRIKLVVRDWGRTLDGQEKGAEKAYCYFPQAMSISGGRQATLTKFVNNAKNKLGVALSSPRSFMGLAANFQLSPAAKGNGDILSIVGRPKMTMPDGLAPYVPKAKAEDERVAEEPEGNAFSVSSEAAEAMRDLLGNERGEKESKRLLGDKAFRARFPSAYAVFLANPTQVLSDL